MKHQHTIALVLFALLAATAWPAARAEEAARPPALRFTETTAALAQLPPEARTALAQNAEGQPLDALNTHTMAINQIELDNSASVATPGADLRVVSWNIERGRHWREAARLLQAHPVWKDADILLISEMDLGLARSGNEHTTRELAQALGMNYAYGVEYLELWEGGKRLDGRNADHAHGYHGNAILSRFPLKNARMLRFPGIDRWWGSSQHRLGGRNAILAEIDPPRGEVTLVSTHLESALTDNTMRVEQIQMILDELAAHTPGNPVIFGGDLNAVPKSDPIRLLQDGGFDLESCNDLGEGTSQGRKRDGGIGRFMRIDYIAVRGLKAHSPAVLDAVFEKNGAPELISDHAAVAAIISF